MQRFFEKRLTINVIELILFFLIAAGIGWFISESTWSFAARKAAAENGNTGRPNPEAGR